MKFFILSFLLIQNAFAWRPENNLGMVYGKKEVCEQQSKVSCYECPSEGASTGCIDYSIVDRYVDDPEKPIKGFKEAIVQTYFEVDAETGEETQFIRYSCEDGFELIEEGPQSGCFGIIGYEQKIDGKKLAFDQSLYDARIANEAMAQEESRQKQMHDEKLNEAMKYFLEQAVRTPEGQYLPKEEWQKKLKEAVHGKGLIDRAKELFN
jgi:hypothetical protein